MSDERNEPVEINHDGVIHETNGAKLFQVGDEKVWIPRSQILDEDDDTFSVPQWLAEEKELV